MTVRELIGVLEEQDPDAEVRLMIQPSWPFEHAIAGVWTPDEPNPYDDESGFLPADTDGPVVYLTEGRQLAYGSKRAWS